MLQDEERASAGARLFGVVITLSLVEPYKECLGRLANLLASRDVDVFLAGSGAPFLDHVFAENVFVIEEHEDVGGQLVHVWIVLAVNSDESFDASEEGFLVFLGGDHL